MVNKRIISLIMMIIIGLSLIITIPIFTLSSGLSNYGTIDELITFKYAPDNSSPIEKLNLNIDVGDVEIKYITKPVNYLAKIIVRVAMTGEGIAGKSYLDYFSFEWENTSTIPTFSMELKSELEQMEVLSLIKNTNIIVYLRADIVFDITVTVIEGNIDLNVPFGVIINNVKLNITIGNLFYDFRYCTLEGNITGIANDGNIELMAYNPEYTRNTIWTYKSIAGDITIDISHINHNKIMNANITGSLVGNDFRDVILTYYDNTANIGARITLNDTIQALDLPIQPHISDWEGFEDPIVLKDPSGYEFTSTDFPAITNYNLFLKGIDQSQPNAGWYEVHLSSS